MQRERERKRERGRNRDSEKMAKRKCTQSYVPIVKGRSQDSKPGCLFVSDFLSALIRIEVLTILTISGEAVECFLF